MNLATCNATSAQDHDIKGLLQSSFRTLRVEKSISTSCKRTSFSSIRDRFECDTVLQEAHTVKKCYATRVSIIQHLRAHIPSSLRYHSLTLVLLFVGLTLIKHSPGIPPVYLARR